MPKIISIILCFLLIIYSYSVSADDKNMIEVAKKYYDALYQKNFDFVRSIASEEFIFSDPTVLAKQGLPPKLESLSSFLNYMDKSISTEIEFDIEIIDSFESNANVVLYVENKIKAPASFFGGESSANINVTVKGVTVLTFDNGKITKHTDYFDYPSLNIMIKSQL